VQFKKVLPINVVTPQETCWDFIRLFESVSYVQKVVKKERGIAINLDQAREIVWCVKHGRLFFESADVSDIYISPLLYYYGVLSFSHAVTLLKHPRIDRLRSCSPSHGVGIKNKQSFKTPSEIEIKFQSRGAFPELLESVDCQIVFEEKYKAAYLRTAKPETLKNSSVTFKEIVARIPEMVYFYRRLFEEKPKCHPSDWKAEQSTSDGHLQKIKYMLYVDPISGMDEKSFQDLIKTKNYVKKPGTFPVGGRKYSSYTVSASGSTFPIFYKALSGQNYILESFPFGNFNEISLHFLLTYILGMLVRYRPDIWSDMLSTNRNIELPLLVNLIRIVKVKTPMLFLNHFSNDYYDIRYPAKLVGIGGMYL